ncbi:MAG: LysR family transcriptional regulator [Acetobacteraceae bacterium]
MIDLRRLRAFVAVAEERHVTRAAERLGMQQPPLTRLLRGLEEELGVPLLRRLPRGVQPTEAGQVLLEEARAVLARAAELQEAVRRVARGETGRLAVGFTPSAALHPFVPAVLRAFREEAPGLRVELDEAGTTELADALQHGRLDAAFVRSPVGSVPGLLVEPVLDEPMVAALPDGHRLATAGEGSSALPLAALAAEAFILYRRPSGPGLYDAILAACRAAGFSPRVAQEAPRLPASLSLVAAGLGVSVVPASMRRLAVAGVAYRDLTDCPGLSAPLHLALRQAGLTAAVARFRSAVRRSAAGRSG